MDKEYIEINNKTIATLISCIDKLTILIQQNHYELQRLQRKIDKEVKK